MATRRSGVGCAAVIATCVGAIGLSTPAHAQLSGTTTQLTTNPLPQLDPAIAGDLVVFTDQRNGNDDVYFVDVASMVETQVTSSVTNQRLNDVSAGTIVFTDLTAPGTRVQAYDVASASTTTVS